MKVSPAPIVLFDFVVWLDLLFSGKEREERGREDRGFTYSTTFAPEGSLYAGQWV